MISNKIIDRINKWLEKNVKIEITYREHQQQELENDLTFPDQDKLYMLWQEEAETENNPLVLIDHGDSIRLYLASSYNDEDNHFTGYLICEIKKNSIKLSNKMNQYEFYEDVWTSSIGIPSPNEIILYETAQQLNLTINEDKNTKKEEIESNFIETLYVDIFYSTVNNSWYYGFLALTDLNQELLSYDQFLDMVVDEVKLTFPEYEKKEDIEFTFGLYYYHNHELKPLTYKNYAETIEKYAEGNFDFVLFYTEDQNNVVKMYSKMKRHMEIREKRIKLKIERHKKYIKSII
jgi:hypothetical protein